MAPSLFIEIKRHVKKREKQTNVPCPTAHSSLVASNCTGTYFQTHAILHTCSSDLHHTNITDFLRDTALNCTVRLGGKNAKNICTNNLCLPPCDNDSKASELQKRQAKSRTRRKSYRPVLVCRCPHNLENPSHLVHVIYPWKQGPPTHQLREYAAHLGKAKQRPKR